MDDKRSLLKQIGWSDELINKCLSDNVFSDKKIPVVEYYVPVVFEQDTTILTININEPIINDGTHLV
jgi:hypothetical protein